MRKRLLEYDDVMNAQRKAIYKKRKNALFGERLDVDVDNMFYDTAENTVIKYWKGDFQEFENELLRDLNIQSPVSIDEFQSVDQVSLTEKVYMAMINRYKTKNERIIALCWPQIKFVQENESNKYKTMAIPLSDGIRMMQVGVQLEEAYNAEGLNIPIQLEKAIVLGIIDNEWKEHLREMDDLRSAVNNAQYEQKDPLLIYKLESFELFKSMLNRLNKEAVELLLKLDLEIENPVEASVKEIRQENQYEKQTTSSSTAPERIQGSQGYDQAIQNSISQPVKQAPVVAEDKIGRNEACPCGSGKKYKQCHGK